jgi:hypothetical protein
MNRRGCEFILIVIVKRSYCDKVEWAALRCTRRHFSAKGVDVPSGAVVSRFGLAPVYCGPYCYEHVRYWRRDYDRYGFDHFLRERWYRR